MINRLLTNAVSITIGTLSRFLGYYEHLKFYQPITFNLQIICKITDKIKMLHKYVSLSEAQHYRQLF
jgi:hypothetical protein